jgi:hypothetical protein
VKQYGYNPIKKAFFHLKENPFTLYDMVEVLYENHKINDKGFLIIKNNNK